MDTKQSLWTSLRKHVWDVISLRLWVMSVFIALVLTIWTMFDDLMIWLGGKIDTLPIWDMLQLVLFLILTQTIFITIHNMYFSDVPKQNSHTSDTKKEFPAKLMTAVCNILIFMSMVLIWVMFSEYMLKLISGLLGTKNDRAKTLSSIGYGMGGVLAVIGAIAINQRANAEVENNRLIEEGQRNEQFKNKLIENGQRNERFKFAMENLRSTNPMARISTFDEFYYLAKSQQDPEFKKRIFETLCSYLRAMRKETSECEKKKEEYEMERQTLFNILFKDKFKSEGNGLIPDNVPADLRNVHLDEMELSRSNLSGANLFSANLSGAFLMYANLSSANLFKTILSNAYLIDADFSKAILFGADLSGANLENSNFQGAELQDAKLKNAISVKGADFRRATILGKPITKDDLPVDKGEYYAEWNPPPKKEED